MPFLIIENPHKKPVHVDEKKLQNLLCPYSGRITRVERAEYILYSSSLVQSTAAAAGHFFVGISNFRSQNTPWCEFTFGSTKIEFQTDPLCMFPLWKHTSAEGLVIYTPELKSLQAIPGLALKFKSDEELLRIERRPPGFCFLQNTERVNLPLTPQPNPSTFFANFTQAQQALKQALLESFSEIKNEAQVGTFLSGGIDSSTATALLAQKSNSVFTYTLGSSFGNEFKDAQEVAQSLHTQHHEVMIQDSQVPLFFAEVIRSNEVFDGLTAEILLQNKALLNPHSNGLAQQTHLKAVLTGYGADLLFGGMLKHEGYLQAVGVKDSVGLIERTIWSGEMSPFLFWQQGIAPLHLYWHPAVLKVAAQIPFAMNFEGEIVKTVLRATSVNSGWLPKEFAYRPKLGMTNGTMIHEILSREMGWPPGYQFVLKTQYALKKLKAEMGLHS